MAQSEIVGNKKNHFKKVIFSFFILLLPISIGIFFTVSYFRSDRYFMIQIQKRIKTSQDLHKNYAYFLSNSNSALQYLVLLKRLDMYDMNTKFQETVNKALQEYPTLEIQALALDQRLYTNNFNLFSSFSFNIKDIYQQYPALVRYYLYAQYQTKDEFTHTTMESIDSRSLQQILYYDELLQFLYSPQENTYTVYDYYTLYNLTNREIFQFILYIYYSVKGEANMSSILLSSIDDIWKIEQKDLLKKSNAILSNDRIPASTVISNDSFYAIALDLYSNDKNSALLYLHRIVETYGIKELDNTTLEFYFWLSRNFSKEYDNKKLDNYFVQIQNRMYNSISLALQYILYLYTIDPEKGRQILETFQFSTRVLESPYIQYLKILLEGFDVRYQNVFLQQKLEEISTMEDIHVSLFYDLLLLRAGKMVKYYNTDSVSIFFLRYTEFENVLFPHKIYHLLKNGTIHYLTQAEKKNIIARFHAKDTPWWNTLNVAIWNIKNKNFATALRYLQLSQNSLPYFNSRLQIQYLIQYTRIAILQKKYDLAELYIGSLQRLQATNRYIQLLQNMLKQSKMLHSSEISKK